MSNDMRGLFFIVKGRYKKGAKPSFHNKVSNEVSYIGGYDPYEDHTEEWYMAIDNKTYHCVACGSDLKTVLKGIYNTILKHKGDAKHYFKHVSSITSDDYYETHYLGKRPLTREQRVKKAEGRCPRVSPVMREMYEHIYEEFGDFFSEEIEEMEDLAYSELVDRKPYKKSKKLVSKVKPRTTKVEMIPPKKEVVNNTTGRLVRPKVKTGFKKLPL